MIVGDPGSGKSTFLRRITFELAGAELGLQPTSRLIGWLGDKDEQRLPFPLLIRVGDLTRTFRHLP